ncbi:pimeloyl-ACP methyl ester carboxylesterase [Nakamurella sp. UYEF19]|uniref:alpha/beta fold hydrolase n=1 Tax=Nakamurella sp. UYEF19 TaxID=1756392 RepID=UPI0033995068
MATDIVEHTVDSGGVRINVATAGQGRPVLLLHGFPDSWHLWESQIQALAQSGHRVVAPDLRGHGESDRPEDVAAYRMPRLIADILAVLADLGIEKTAVVGHDWGAALAWSFTFRHPERVERLTVLSVGHPGASISAGLVQRQLSWYMLWFLHVGVAESVLPAGDWQAFREWAWQGVDTDPLMDGQIAGLSRPGALVAALNLYRANIRPETYFLSDVPQLPRVSCPVLGVWSSGDLFLTREQMERSGEWIDGPWQFAEVPGPHWIPAQAPAELNALLLDFLA